MWKGRPGFYLFKKGTISSILSEYLSIWFLGERDSAFSSTLSSCICFWNPRETIWKQGEKKSPIFTLCYCKSNRLCYLLGKKKCSYSRERERERMCVREVILVEKYTHASPVLRLHLFSFLRRILSFIQKKLYQIQGPLSTKFPAVKSLFLSL